MNTQLEQQIRFSGRQLSALFERLGDCPQTRDHHTRHLQLLRQRTPGEHAELARRLGLPTSEAA